ncbi:sensor histidine kinase [Kineococcus auxinigenes]|uniref:sensor histidine kinase n=1 Tax=unclassified Kineococcus TaxID=2621656 RepID=UPI003D7D1976
MLLVAAVALDVRFISAAVETRRIAKFAGTADEGSQLLVALQNERLASVGSLIEGSGTTAEEIAAARAATDAATAALGAELVEVGLETGDGSATAKAVAEATSATTQISRVRAVIDGGNTTAAQTLTAFDGFISVYSDLALAVAEDASDRELALEQAGFAYLVKQSEAASREQAAGLLVLSGVSSASVAQVRSTSIAQQDFFADQAQAQLSAELAGEVDTVLNASQAAQARAFVSKDRNAFTAAGSGVPSFTQDEWMSATTTVINALNEAASIAGEHVSDHGDEDAATAVREGVLLSLLTLLVAGGAIFFAVAAARNIGTRLRALSAAATEVRDELPRMVERMQTPGEGPGVEFTPLTVTSTDEIGQVAHVINDLNETTFRIAGEQAALRASIAEMFINVARRDQALLARQLSFLDQLERTEENPDTLEDLFTLDHLATRMRRNAESLLVLAGINTGRRLRRPLPLSDVIRTAAGEIEHYDRVDLALQVDPPVVGHLALSMAHLLAELLENATNFSDPGSRVVVGTKEGPRGIEVTITDTGLGMDEEEVRAARERIDGGRASEFVGAQRLGFYVVGRLAARLDLDVAFDSTEGEGTSVTLLLGPAVFTPGSVSAQVPELEAQDGPPALPAAEPAPAADAVALPAEPAAPAGASTIVANPLAADGVGSALSVTLERSAASAATESGVSAPAPQVTGTGRSLPTRRKPTRGAGADEARASAAPAAPAAPAVPVAPVAPAAEPGWQPVSAPSAPADALPAMPKRERKAEAPASLAAAQDILPRAGRKPRAVRESATPPKTAAEAFWTSRRRASGTAAEEQAPEAPAAVPEPAAAQVPDAVRAPLAPEPAAAPAEPARAVPVVPAQATAPEAAAAPVAVTPAARTVGDTLRQRNALAAEALSALTEGQGFNPSMANGSAPLVRRQAGATPAAAKPAPVRPAAARQRRAPADVRSMLSGFQAGVSRGRAEGDAPTAPAHPGGADGDA